MSLNIFVIQLKKCVNSLIRKLSIEEFINRARKAHGDRYDYSKSVYFRTDHKLIIICKEHGEFKQKPNAHLSGQGCFDCYRKRHYKNYRG